MIRDERVAELRADGINQAKWAIEKLLVNSASRITYLTLEKQERAGKGQVTRVIEESLIQERQARAVLEAAFAAVEKFSEGR